MPNPMRNYFEELERTLLLDAVDEKCKAEDAERRRMDKARRPARSPKSKSKH